jgi:hypothetical protein
MNTPRCPGTAAIICRFYYEFAAEITKIVSWQKSRAAKKTSKSPPKITLKTVFLGVKSAKNEQKKSPARKPGRV